MKPRIELSDIRYQADELHFQLFRTEGADVYGSFLIEIAVLNESGDRVLSLGQRELSQLLPGNIRNHYVAQVKPGKHSLVIPLGAKADLSIPLKGLNTNQTYRIQLTDISGLTWDAGFKIH
ncbi:TQO small subunit DoxA domain-containing protein [Niabella hibiscisoli]|uniref:TQO small subunit DoxA domain-containing protein n=1 Tax=Niabella hibiscisoli TaxID=1825928 RepID=UPI001F0E11AE|nr:TQO small subunit DoxA domain-containing protein [Niabella hibiscisoli]MCH5720366.1 hypothetical protein [Niabella hibiscisoli]